MIDILIALGLGIISGSLGTVFALGLVFTKENEVHDEETD